MENITLDFETDLIQISNIEYFEALFKILVNYNKNQIGKYPSVNQICVY